MIFAKGTVSHFSLAPTMNNSPLMEKFGTIEYWENPIRDYANTIEEYPHPGFVIFCKVFLYLNVT